MKIKLTLYKSVIVEAVKAETFLKGQIDKSTKEGTEAFVYNETAGDEEVHERKIARAIETATSTLISEIANFIGGQVSTSGSNAYQATASDNIYTEVDSTNNDKVYLYIIVGDRFNQALTEPLAKLCSKYIEDSAISSWYGALGLANQVQYYQALVVAGISNIKKSLAKGAPIAVKIPYTKTLSVTGSSLSLSVGDEESLTYTIDDDSIDDIEASCSNKCIKINRGNDCFYVKAIRAGVCTLTLYSRHDESVKKQVEVTVS